MEEVDEEQQDLLSEEQEEAKPDLDIVRIMAILFILVVYLVIFAKIIFLK